MSIGGVLYQVFYQGFRSSLVGFGVQLALIQVSRRLEDLGQLAHVQVEGSRGARIGGSGLTSGESVEVAGGAPRFRVEAVGGVHLARLAAAWAFRFVVAVEDEKPRVHATTPSKPKQAGQSQSAEPSPPTTPARFPATPHPSHRRNPCGSVGPWLKEISAHRSHTVPA
jgi:hypothetical protein